MYWADRAAKEIIASGKYKPYWVDDMKTPSGRIHVGSLRGVVVHDLVYKALQDVGEKPTFSYVFEDSDPMDSLPIYLDKDTWSTYLGQPLFTIPSPDGKAKNYATYFAQEFEEVFNRLGCHPKIFWTGDFYRSGKMNEYIKLCLDKTETIKKIYEKTYKKSLPDSWFPFQPVCPNCGKLLTTHVNGWDGKEIKINCRIDAVDWTRGCGQSTMISPFSDEKYFAGKLSWKIEWPVKWKLIGVTIEGGGKDHMSAGGSYDIAKQLCTEILSSTPPYPVAHEFFLIGGKKMSSSKGVGSSAFEVSQILPPELLRFLMVRSHIDHAINFDPMGWTIPDLFDEYDRCWKAYITGSDPDLARIFELSQITDTFNKENVFLPRFRAVAQVEQLPTTDSVEYFSDEKGAPLTDVEITILKERIVYAKKWLADYAPDEVRFQATKEVPKVVTKLTEKQKEFLRAVSVLIHNYSNSDEFGFALYKRAKDLSIPIKDAFAAIYLSFLGKTHGPKAAAFLLNLPRDFVRQRFEDVLDNNKTEKQNQYHFEFLNKPDLFSINAELAQKYPSISVGFAIIRDVMIEKENSELEKEKAEFLKSLERLTTEQLGTYPELISYRKLYKETGIDWHSRRPSPEALLRRVALKKGLYSINTCVDAYNLIVMKHRVSVGAFDVDAVHFPTVLRFAKKGETIHLLGDDKPTEYQSGEIAYFDTLGGYNMDFNYRDSVRTAVSEKTKNLMINIDGIFDITRTRVEQSLQETLDIVTTYCGGKVEIAGIVAA